MQLEISVLRDTNLLVPILHDADEDDARITEAITDVANTPYAVFLESECIGAALLHWQPDESEIIYIAIRSSERGQGYGKALIAGIINFARQQPTQALMVGTANTSIENIMFYQKCGFRVDSVRKDYFTYFQTPIYEHGILIRDMLVLRYDLST
jgi:ribosomal protein S18 acetylase RimI-like enzyme